MTGALSSAELNQETHEKFFEHAVYSSGGRDLAVIEGTFVATRTLKDIKGPPESELMQYLQSKGVFVSVKRFKTIKLKSIGFIYKVSPEFTYQPIYEAVVKDEFTEKLQAEEEVPGIEVSEIELIPKLVWHKRPKTKRQVRAKCLEVRFEEMHAPVVKNLMTATGEEDDEDDSGSLVPYSFSSEMKVEMLRTQNEFNASLRGMKVDGIHKDVMYGYIPTKEGIDADLMTLYAYVLKVKHPRALCASDLKSCYDRVVHAISSLAMRRVGMPVEPIICMFSTIQDLEHHVRTIYGDSKKSFGGNL
jgi:hypothetical protein